MTRRVENAPFARSNAFVPCKACDGHGFLRTGDFASRKFPRCPSCDGCGQIYLDPVPPPPVERKPTAVEEF